ncbi:hypothetical protein ACFXKK_04765 [Streptomyces globisporus]
MVSYPLAACVVSMSTQVETTSMPVGAVSTAMDIAPTGIARA